MQYHQQTGRENFVCGAVCMYVCMYVKFIYSWLKKKKLQHILIQYIKNVLQSSSPKETNLNQLELLSLIVPEAA